MFPLAENEKITVVLPIKTFDDEHVSRAESIRKIKVLTTDFTEANGLLTPSLKVKRLEATRRLASIIDEIYGGPVQA